MQEGSSEQRKATLASELIHSGSETLFGFLLARMSLCSFDPYNSNYQLVGEACVHEIMQGKVVRSVECQLEEEVLE